MQRLTSGALDVADLLPAAAAAQTCAALRWMNRFPGVPTVHGPIGTPAMVDLARESASFDVGCVAAK